MVQSRTAKFLLAAAAMNVAIAFAQPAASQAVPATDVPQLRDALYDTAAKSEMREQAAQRLLSRPDPSARTAIVDALGGTANVQLAAARALATHPTADPEFRPAAAAAARPVEPRAAARRRRPGVDRLQKRPQRPGTPSGAGERQ
ncbi:MAG: hypothetical protein QM754_19445 [Tepidisphaeraceae bacterium]